MCERARRPLAHDEMRFDSRAVHHLQQTHTEDRSGGAGDADYESRSLHASLHFATKKAGHDMRPASKICVICG